MDGILSTVEFILNRRKDWKEGRKAKAEAAVDSRVLELLQDREHWQGPRPITGGGYPLVRTAELAQAMSLEVDIVADSLERLELRGRVRNAQGTQDNPAPYWHIILR